MKTQQEIDYTRIADAIGFFRENFKAQPKLDEVAEHVNLSPFHFQRMFKDWAGVTQNNSCSI
ncbi:AraC family transcriptional regulator [Mucilaginibacter metallidurans]|uniref:AraC family transcriptional regulator n=1 Tax=Mucilaginibacter sp. P4 TaxID=3383180 RepID=UPI00268036AC|nr:AraC family transcriptional regulator [Mucilaginibacter gossypii]